MLCGTEPPPKTPSQPAMHVMADAQAADQGEGSVAASSQQLMLHEHDKFALHVLVCAAYLQALGYGPPELVTCGRDGCVRVWDVRQEDAPVAAFEPADSNNIRCAGRGTDQQALSRQLTSVLAFDGGGSWYRCRSCTCGS